MIERKPHGAAEELESWLRELARKNVELDSLRRGHLSHLKPRVRRWLKIGIEFPLGEVLTDEEEKMVKFYSGLDGEDKIHSVLETVDFLGRLPQAERFVAFSIRYCWIKLKRRELVGPEAVETLKTPDFLYRSLTRNGIAKVDDILKLSDKELIRVCGSDFGLSQLKEAMRAKGIDFNPEIEFPLFAYPERGKKEKV